MPLVFPAVSHVFLIPPGRCMRTELGQQVLELLLLAAGQAFHHDLFPLHQARHEFVVHPTAAGCDVDHLAALVFLAGFAADQSLVLQRGDGPADVVLEVSREVADVRCRDTVSVMEKDERQYLRTGQAVLELDGSKRGLTVVVDHVPQLVGIGDRNIMKDVAQGLVAGHFWFDGCVCGATKAWFAL